MYYKLLQFITFQKMWFPVIDLFQDLGLMNLTRSSVQPSSKEFKVKAESSRASLERCNFSVLCCGELLYSLDLVNIDLN